MYQIYYDGALVFDPRLMNSAEPGDETHAVTAATLRLAVGSAGSLTFTLAPGHEMIGVIEQMAGVVKVVDTVKRETVFLGRVINDTLGLDNSRTYECEGLLARLNDSAVPPHSFPDDYLDDPAYQAAAQSGNVVSFWLEKLLAYHNAMCWRTEHMVRLGTVTVADSENYIERSSETWASTWNVIADELANSALGGYLVARYDGDTTYLDYLAAFPEENAQQVRFAGNLLDLERTLSGAELFNAVIPIGKDGLTCAAAPNGYYGDQNQYYKQAYYILDPADRDAHGLIVRVVEWNEAESAQELVQRSVAILSARGEKKSIRVSAADLSAVDETEPRFRIARQLRIVSPPHSIRDAYPVMEVDIDLHEPVRTLLTLGEQTKSISSYVSVGSNTAAPMVAVDAALSPTSENPVQNKVVTAALDSIGGSRWTATATDYDDLTANGTYWINAGVTTAHAPCGYWGMLEVFNNAAIQQRFTSYPDMGVYVRQFVNNAWTSWVQK